MSSSARSGGVLCLDVGTKKHGFASCDALRLSTQPIEPFRCPPNSPELLAHIAQLLSDRDIGTLLLGLPLHADGTEGPQCKIVRELGARLAKHFPDLELDYQDEHLSTRAAEQWLAESDLSKAERKRWRDSAAAVLVLRDWLGAR